MRNADAASLQDVPGRAFLRARWLDLIMLNWQVPPALLQRHVPAGTTLDSWNGQYFISLVAFRFENTRVLGIPVPFHRNFEEVNLRFYVRRETSTEVRRAVVFIRELVPRAAIALIARALYNEPYRSVRMSHRIVPPANGAERTFVEYGWKHDGQWTHISASPSGTFAVAAPDSLEEFITEHYWGYTRQRDGGTVEYRVQHPRWRVANVSQPAILGDLSRTYGSEFGQALAGAPDSAFLADGSAISVHLPTRLPPAG